MSDQHDHDDDEPMSRERIQEALHWLAAKGLIYDSGGRRNGQIVWVSTPGKEAEVRALLGSKDHPGE
jgi:hypothetical protein